MEVCPGQVTAVESDHCAVDPDAFSHLTGHHRPGDFTMAWHQQFGCGDAKVRERSMGLQSLCAVDQVS